MIAQKDTSRNMVMLALQRITITLKVSPLDKRTVKLCTPSDACSVMKSTVSSST